jgi:hypothetical protein
VNTPIVIEGVIPLGRRGHADHPVPSARVPRLARLLAVAWHVQGLVRSGAVSSYAVAAKLGHVSRARLSQILSLLNLAPDLQEHLLFLQRPARGRRALTLRQVLKVAAALDWAEQRRRWRKLRRAMSTRRERQFAVGSPKKVLNSVENCLEVAARSR